LKDIIQQSLNKTQIESTRGVEQILNKKLPQQAQIDLAEAWGLVSYGLSPVSCLQNLSPEQNAKIRTQLAYARFLEAYHIEHAGMCFAAKMSLMAQSLHEQKLFSLFAAEEATHFHFIEAVIGTPQTDKDPFIELLHEIIRSAERRPLIFIIQVILEGWGLDHYGLMKKTCQNQDLQAYLLQILQDEAAHHGSGLSLFNENDLSAPEFDYIQEMLVQFLNMVRIGPVSMLYAIENTVGSMTNEQKNTALEQMQAHQETERKLNLLRDLMHKAQAHKTLEILESKQAFKLLF